MVLLRLSSATGSLLGHMTSRGASTEHAQGLAVGDTYAHVVGYYWGTGVWGGTSTTARGAEDAFVWKTPLP